MPLAAFATDMDGIDAGFMKRVVLLILENQVRYESPPETRQALDRLTAAGAKRGEAMERIASAVMHEVWRVLRGESFDRDAFTALLAKVE